MNADGSVSISTSTQLCATNPSKGYKAQGLFQFFGTFLIFPVSVHFPGERFTMDTLFAALTPEEKQAFLNGPALAPPPGVVPNFTNPPNRLRLCVGVTVITITVSVIVVFLRLYTRIFRVKKMRLEDCMLRSGRRITRANYIRSYSCGPGMQPAVTLPDWLFA